MLGQNKPLRIQNGHNELGDEWIRIGSRPDSFGILDPDLFFLNHPAVRVDMVY